MKRILAPVFILTFCIAVAQASADGYKQIDQETAKQMMVQDDGRIIVDVRTSEEYGEGHIPDAICIPNESISTSQPVELPDLDQVILVYCRSGRRSKEAAQKLANIGYSSVYEFGGIIDWTGEIVTENAALTYLSVTRIGEIAYGSYQIRRGTDGYYFPVNEGAEKRVSLELINELMKIIEKYKVMDWDGFNGTPDGDILDGEQFWMEIRFTDGTGMKAKGDNAFPLNYGKAMDSIWRILNWMEEENSMRLLINETEVPIVWEDNESVAALKILLPLTIQMSMYGGFEQVGPIGQSIAQNDQQTVTESGDIVLYSGNQIVIFYGSNSWAYTRLGHVELSQDEIARLLSNGDVTITITE